MSRTPNKEFKAVLAFNPPLALAPMAGVTNHAFRLLCRRFGASAVWTEMISSYGILHRNPKTLQMFDWTDEEQPVVVQIFGADPHVMAHAAKVVADAGASAVDINLGCPVRKVIKTGAGASLMLDLERAKEVINAVVKASSVPVTVKTRKGPDETQTTAVKIAQMAEAAGVAAVTIHGRTSAQRYAGKADWEIIARVKESVRIPVIGNGDVKTPLDATRMIAMTGCDAVMIGRAALGNPLIFEQTSHYLATNELLPEPNYAERARVAKEHLRLMIDLYGEEKAVREMRGQIGRYLKGMPGAAHLRHLISAVSSVDEMLRLIDEVRGSEEPKKLSAIVTVS